MTARQRLRNRRRSERFELELNGLRHVASFSRFNDGRVAEIFLQNHKPASQSDANARDTAIAASCNTDVRLRCCGDRCCATPRAAASTPLGVALGIIAEERGCGAAANRLPARRRSTRPRSSAGRRRHDGPG
jgi:hypothetical protein